MWLTTSSVQMMVFTVSSALYKSTFRLVSEPAMIWALWCSKQLAILLKVSQVASQHSASLLAPLSTGHTRQRHQIDSACSRGETWIGIQSCKIFYATQNNCVQPLAADSHWLAVCSEVLDLLEDHTCRCPYSLPSSAKTLGCLIFLIL